MEKGIFISEDILKIEGLNFIEKGILAIYRTYTIYGSMKCCMLRKEQIAEELGISEKTVQRTRAKLKELGLIKTNGGNTVWYIGQMDKLSPKRTNCPPKVVQNVPQGGTKCPPKVVQNVPHNINNKNINKKEFKSNEMECYNINDWLDKIDLEEIYLTD